MNSFRLIALTPAGTNDPSLAIAASRAGEWGVLDLEHCRHPHAALAAIEQLARHARHQCGVKLDSAAGPLFDAVTEVLADPVRIVVLTASDRAALSGQIGALHAKGLTVILEATSLEEARLGQTIGVDGLIAKGHEAGGWVGDETTFVLLQHIRAHVALPVWAQGGIGLHTAAACFAAGAAGVVLGDQLLLARESPLSAPIKTLVARLDGSETTCIGGDIGKAVRVLHLPLSSSVDELRRAAAELESHPPGQRLDAWRRNVLDRVGWAASGNSVCLLGQDASFASHLAKRFSTVGGILHGVRTSIKDHLAAAQRLKPLDEGAPLAQSHVTRYPIVQGPMTRVSDRAAFALQVAEGGGLPFLALALMRAHEVDALLEETSRLLQNRPWGVGILGFVPFDLRQEQLAVVKKHKPRHALIAGGRPDQARSLEAEGISTYLHVPSPGLLKMFLEEGARRFVFEGRECGGHVGPRSSFVLWDTMIELLLEQLPSGPEAERCHVLFAGGIHDSLSSSMVAALAAPLAARGIRIGVLMGTAYLFTDEAVSAGAIQKGFQDEAIRCSNTVLLETGPGHSTRCADTSFAQTFQEERRRLSAERRSPEEIRDALEALNLGRLRIAAKGIVRNPQFGQGHDALRYLTIEDADQRRQGMYMIGQVAALRDRCCTIQELHHDVSVHGTERLTRLTEPHATAAGTGRRTRPSDVAIIGIGCLLPKAPDTRAFWDNVLGKVNAITEIPEHRWDVTRYFDPDRKARDKVYSRWGGFLDEVPFDPMRYGMPPNSLKSIEPLQLLMLEVVRQALHNAGFGVPSAGLPGSSFPHERTSVILGVGGGVAELGQQYGLRSGLPMLFDNLPAEIWNRLPEWTEDSFAGILLNVAAGRVANRFDLGGANFTVDAACASSLAAIYQAVQELESGASDMVIAGGADTVQSPFGYLCFSKTQALSPRGRCRTFDEGADGIVISEGLGVVVLKRLEDAERDGDRIYAVIKAVGASSDGRDKGLTAPRPEGQIRALDRAYEKAGFSPATIGLFEAHGTGTVAGDQAEGESLMRVLAASGAQPQATAIGSLKSMIGHTKCAAGVAGLMKMALALHHKVLPPTINVEKPNPTVFYPESPLYVNSETRPWLAAADHPRRAGVSSFGFGGTNFHAVLEEYTGNYLEAVTPVSTHWPTELFYWAGGSRQELEREFQQIERALAGGMEMELHELAAAVWRQTHARLTSGKHCPIRAAIVAASLDDLQRKLSTALKSWMTDPQGIYIGDLTAGGPGKVAFLFPGQGSQYPDMLRDLAVQFPEVRESFESAGRALAGRFPKPLNAYIFPSPRFSEEEKKRDQAALTATNVAQPALGAAGAGLFRLLQQLGLQPEMAAGHSYGEYVALHAAGFVDETTLYHLSETRGRMIIEAAEGRDLGTMAAVEAGADSLGEVAASIDGLSIANLNGPNQTILSGSKEAIARAIEQLTARGVTARPIPVACAFHSTFVAPARDRFADYLHSIACAAPRFDVYSNTTGDAHPADPGVIIDALADHLVRPVDFIREIEAMYKAGARIFVEVGPRGVLTGLTRAILGDRPHLAVATDLPARDGRTQLQHALAQIAVRGVPVELDRLFEGRSARQLNLSALESLKPAPLPPTTWMIGGGGIRKFSEARTALKPPIALNTGEVQQVLSQQAHSPHHSTPLRPSPALNGSGNGNGSISKPSPALPTAPSTAVDPRNGPHNGSAASSNIDAVLIEYQQLMRRFLDTQKQVMLTYLQGTPEPHPPVPPPTPLPLMATQSTDAASPQTMQEPLSPATSPSAAPPPPAAPVASPTAAPTPATLNSPAGPDQVTLTEMLVQLVADRTGYPRELLGLDLNLEADLGIDSIKRVEIMGAFRRQLGPDHEQRISRAMEQFTGVKTLRGIIDTTAAILSTSPTTPASLAPQAQMTSPAAPTPVTAPTIASAAAPDTSTAVDQAALTEMLVQLVADRTGYPRELLGLDLNLEADLGIDSIKRVEIMGAFRRQLGPDHEQRISRAMEQFTGVKTLRGIVGVTAGILTAHTASVALPPVPAAASTGAPAASSTAPARSIPRFLLQAVGMPLDRESVPDVSGRRIVITDDGRGIADALGSMLTRLGADVVTVAHGPSLRSTADRRFEANLADPSEVDVLMQQIHRQHGTIDGLVHLLPLREAPPFDQLDFTVWRDRVRVEIKSLFYLVKAAAPDLKAAGRSQSAWVIGASSMGNVFGTAGDSPLTSPHHGGIAGLIKVLAVEWPEVRCTAVDFDPAEEAPALASHLLAEMGARDGQTEVGYRGTARQVLRPYPSTLQTESGGITIGSEDVILITGGACGISAEIAAELAAQGRPTLILIGRTPLPEATESAETRGLTEPAAVKAALIERIRRAEGAVTPAKVEAAYARLLREREIRTNLTALQAAGAKVEYRQADVRDAAAMHTVIDDVYRRHGRLDGVISAAGIIEDKLLEEKTPPSLDRVMDTKVDGAVNLIRAVRPEQLKFFVFFGSVAGRFANRGQGDYGASNEILNKLALHLDRTWRARVVSLIWGPWESGMASPEVQRQFAERGIQVIPPQHGRAAFWRELTQGSKGDVEVVLGDGPWKTAAAPEPRRAPLPLLNGFSLSPIDGGALEGVVVLDPNRHLYLLDHQIDGKPVLPFAFTLELMVEAAQTAWPEWHVVGVRDVRRFKGIIFDDGPKRLRVSVRARTEPAKERLGLDAVVTMSDMDNPGLTCYQGTVELGDRFPEPPEADLPSQPLEAYPKTVDQAYEEWLFHGPRFQQIETIEGASDDAIIADVRPSTSGNCITGATTPWMIDPILIDCGLQLVLLWARAYKNVTPLPSRLGQYVRYGSASGGRVRCVVRILPDADDSIIHEDIFFIDDVSGLIGQIKGMEAVGSQALNRLGGSHITQREAS
jgi:acyl transferase domain-containing protein/NAD(P)H-dependent flavin oxidoreductase YrpB (nitropropane dioxygenase family)/NADP-dependent 3-hydroxy acid dehydrogenase YdfG/acyl carrier protein